MIKRLFAILTLLMAAMAGRAQETADTVDCLPVAPILDWEEFEEPDTLPRSIIGFLRTVDWPRVSTSVGIGLAINYGIGAGIKSWIKEERPDHSDLNSFPSRHASTAFSLCYSVGNFMGPYSPWWLYGAHAVANGIAFERVMHKRHWPSDVMSGAVMGMGVNMLSGTIANWIFGKSLKFPNWYRYRNPFAGGMTISTSISWPLQRTFGQYSLGSGLATNLRASFPVSRSFGLCADAELMTSMVKIGRDFRSPLTSASLMLGGTSHWSHGPYGLSAYALAGYRRYAKCDDVDFGRNAPAIQAGAEGSIMLSRKLAVGAEAGYEFTTLRLGDCRRGVSAIYVGFLTRALF